jgi:hypothetical protein
LLDGGTTPSGKSYSTTGRAASEMRVMDEADLRERAATGARYREYLDDLHAAIDAVEAEYTAEWADTADAAQRENLYRAVRVCRKMKEHFGALVSDGIAATQALTELKRLK